MDVLYVAVQTVLGQGMFVTILPGHASTAVIQATEGQDVNRVSCLRLCFFTNELK